MFRDFMRFMARYQRFNTAGIVLVCALMTLSLFRNNVALSLPWLIAGASGMAFIIMWCILRDSWGYWCYSSLVMRYYFTPQQIEQSEERHRNLDLTQWRVRLFLHPLWSGLVLACCAALVFSLAWYALPARWLRGFIWVWGVVILPLLLLQMLKPAIRLYVYFSSPARAHLRPVRLTRQGRRLVVMNSLLFTLIAGVMTLPIQHRQDFSLAAGATHPWFMAAFTIMLEFLLLLALVFAWRPRRYVILGELLSQAIGEDYLSHPPLAFTRRHSKTWRFLFYAVLMALWPGLVCLIAPAIGISDAFVPLWVLGYLPVLFILLAEGYQCLYEQFGQAREMQKRFMYYRDALRLDDLDPALRQQLEAPEKHAA